MRSPISIIPAGILCKLGTDLKTISHYLKSSARSLFSFIPLSVDGIEQNRPFAFLNHNDTKSQHKNGEMAKQLAESLDIFIPDLTIRKTVPYLLGSTSLNISDTPQQQTSGSDTTLNSIAKNISNQLDLEENPLTITTACTSSAAALIFASRLFHDTNTHFAVVSGLDWYSKQILYGFESLKLLSNNECKPFDSSRNGIVLGEGAASVILSANYDTPVKLKGSSLLLDTYDQTTHQPNGAVIAMSMEKALSDAGLDPSQIQSIKVHGTGSFANDIAEAGAIKLVFGNKIPPIVALKPFTGHTLGACGVVELQVLIATLGSGFLPGVPFTIHPDPECGVKLLDKNIEITYPHTSMLCSFGFGGSCAVLIITIEGPIKW
jgi:3-oxoacyl-[acyl-carrier-protein] synthase-1